MENITMVEYITETYGLKNTLRLVSYALLGASFGILIAIETNSTNKKKRTKRMNRKQMKFAVGFVISIGITTLIVLNFIK